MKKIRKEAFKLNKILLDIDRQNEGNESSEGEDSEELYL